MLDICPGHCAESLSGQVLGTHSSIVRKLFLAEYSFELFVIIFLAISDPDKYWPGHRNIWVRLQVREFGVAFEHMCWISLGLSYFLAQIPLECKECKDLWYLGPQSWKCRSSKSVHSFQLSLGQVLCCPALGQKQGMPAKSDSSCCSWEHQTHR